MADIKVLRKVPIFSSMPEAELQKLSNLAVKMNYPREKVIFFEEDEGDTLFIINSGRVKISKISDDGKEIILSILGPGDFFGEMALLDGELRSATVIAMEKTEVSAIRRRQFHDIIKENPQLSIDLLAIMSQRLRDANRKIGNLALLDVYGRLARMLLDYADQEGEELSDGSISFKRPTHQAIANMIGTSRETVTRTLGDLHRRGYIEISGKNIIVKNLDEDDFDDFH